MKHKMQILLTYIPWFFLLLFVQAFSALLLWLGNRQAFYALLLVLILAPVLFFSVLCAVLIFLEFKREHLFLSFLEEPGKYEEERLLKMTAPAQRDSVRLLGELLRSMQDARAEQQMRLNEQEEYVESWAHEIKTPLSLLTLLLDNRREELPASVSLKLDYIRNRMQESVDQMLFYARIRGTRKDHLFEFLSPGSCLEEVLEDYRPLLLEKGFRIRSSLSGETVYSDRRGLRFLLRQIISNSVKYSSEKPELDIASFQEEDCLILSIRDNGTGVRSCDLPYIFEKGFTGDSGDGRKQATGMGLYLARETAKELKIGLDAASEWGKGLEMRLSFPLVGPLPASGEHEG